MTRTLNRPHELLALAPTLAVALTLALLAGAFSIGCRDDKDCQPYVNEVVDGARRKMGNSPQESARKLRDHLQAVGAKYTDRLKQCRGKGLDALHKALISSCLAASGAMQPGTLGCPAGWDKKRCCQLSAFCILRHPTAADYCDWEPQAKPAPAFPRCTNCPGCVPEGTTPPPRRKLDLWLGGDGDTLAIVADKPVSDVWLLPETAPWAHLEPLLYALWKQPSYLAPNVAIVQGEIVSVDAWNTLERALHQGGWGNMDLNLAQWRGQFRCSPLPTAQGRTRRPGGRTVTVSITADAVWVDGKQLLALDNGKTPRSADAASFTIPSLKEHLQSTHRRAKRPGVLNISIQRGLTVPARLVARIIFTGTQALSGALARITCASHPVPSP